MNRVLSFGLLALGAFLVSSCVDFGEKVAIDENEVYYKDGATKEQAEAVLAILIESGAFDPESKNVAQVLMDGDTYNVNVMVREELQESEEVVDFLRVIGRKMKSQVFNNAPLVVNVTKKNFEVVTKIEIKE